MARKDTELLGLTPLSQSGNEIAMYGLLAGGTGSSLAEQKITALSHKQIHVIHNQRLKAQAANHEIAVLHQNSVKEFQETVIHHAAVKETARGKEYQPIIEEYVQRSTQLAAQHLLGVTEVSARNIGLETSKPLYKDDEKPIVKYVPVPRKGLLQRLFGG